jgi:hypothetical protein
MTTYPPDQIHAVQALIKEAENRHGSMYCKVTTYELRVALGMDVTNWPDTPAAEVTCGAGEASGAVVAQGGAETKLDALQAHSKEEKP